MCGKIDTKTYHDFKIDKSYFNRDLISLEEIKTRMTCYDLFERQYKKMRKFSLPYVRSHTQDIISIH